MIAYFSFFDLKTFEPAPKSVTVIKFELAKSVFVCISKSHIEVSFYRKSI
jgi:hypothetical protein